MEPNNISIGVDIGGTHILCAAVQLPEGRILEKSHTRIACAHDAAAITILRTWADALNSTMAALVPVQPTGIGFAIPGPFDYRKGISAMQHKFKNLYGLHIPTELQPLLTVGKNLPMRFLNDASAFAVGEAWQGAGKSYRKVVVITLGTGFGSAFLEGGVPVINGTGVPSQGCLWHLPFRDSIADDYFSTGWFVRTWATLTGEQTDGVSALLKKTAQDERIDGLFAAFGRNLAECLAPWLRDFGAQALVIGGNIAHALPRFGADLQAGLQRAGVGIRIIPSGRFEDAALLGSARLMEDAFWHKVSEQMPEI